MVVKKCRDSFTYWYGDTSRHSGSDLIYNHLVMYVFNHVALFDRQVLAEADSHATASSTTRARRCPRAWAT